LRNTTTRSLSTAIDSTPRSIRLASTERLPPGNALSPIGSSRAGQSMERRTADIHVLDWRGRQPLATAHGGHLHLAYRAGHDVPRWTARRRMPPFDRSANAGGVDLCRAYPPSKWPQMQVRVDGCRFCAGFGACPLSGRQPGQIRGRQPIDRTTRTTRTDAGKCIANCRCCISRILRSIREKSFGFQRWLRRGHNIGSHGKYRPSCFGASTRGMTITWKTEPCSCGSR